MATNDLQLADEIRQAMGFPTPTSTQLLGFAKAILEELTQNGMATFGGSPTGHSISGMTAASLASKIANYAGYGYVSTELLKYSTGVVNYIQASAIVTYVGPPPPPPDWYLGGTISGIVGSGLAAEIVSQVGYPGTSAPLLAKCTAICDHIVTNASVISGVIS